MSFADPIYHDGLYVNVNGSAGELTRDPITGNYIIAVNTQGTAGTLAGSPSGSRINSTIFANFAPWFPIVAPVVLFGLIFVAFFRKK